MLVRIISLASMLAQQRARRTLHRQQQGSGSRRNSCGQ
jgi:hypothetical protein